MTAEDLTKAARAAAKFTAERERELDDHDRIIRTEAALENLVTQVSKLEKIVRSMATTRWGAIAAWASVFLIVVGGGWGFLWREISRVDDRLDAHSVQSAGQSKQTEQLWEAIRDLQRER